MFICLAENMPFLYHRGCWYSVTGGHYAGRPSCDGIYSIATSLLITILRRLIEKIFQAWLADDAAAAGALEALLEYYDHLVKEGVQFGYLVNGKKSWLIVKAQEVKERA